MPKNGKVDLGDLTLAPRRPVKPGDANPVAIPAHTPESEDPETLHATNEIETEGTAAERRAPQGLLATPAQTRRQAARAKAIEREDTASRLRSLKKSKDRESRHFINIPLDWETKKALEDAAHEHGLKMTVIVRDALAVYLREAGYLRQ